MKYVGLFLLYLLPTVVIGQQSDLSDELMKVIQQRMEDGTYTSLAIGVIDESGPRYYAFGRQKTGGHKVNEHTLYEIGSISKVFTGILLADQIVQEKMKAEDPVMVYLPTSVKVPVFREGGPAISLGHLSDHTSSLPRLPSNMNPADDENPYADYTVQMLYDFLSAYALPREVGSEFEYSNLAVGLLGHILAEDAAVSYDELLKEKITGPLKMEETGVVLSSKMKKSLATGYAMGVEVKNWDLPAFDGAGAIKSSVADLLIFLEANMNGHQSVLREAMALAQKPRHFKAGVSGIGLGWFIRGTNSDTLISHGGATGGYRAFAGFLKKQKKGVVVLTNSDINADDIGHYILDHTTLLQEVRPSITIRLKQIIDDEGVGKLFEKYLDLKREGWYVVEEDKINALGYYYLQRNKVDEAIALFQINIDAFPKAFNVYDSYGEALLLKGQSEEAIENYKKSLIINPGNTNAVEVLTRLGIAVDMPIIKVDETILDTYIGTYEIVPGFNIVITRQGNQLFGQATNQPSFEMFAKNETDFYLQVTNAQVVFSKDERGQMTMTLFQGGQVLPGKRL